jgi:methylated-DNA-[protein]-cysteine S-methyltransferase
VQVVRYEAEGWGVGELWLDGERLAAHELPRRGRAPRARQASPLQDRLVAYFRGDWTAFGDVELDLGWCTPFQREVTRALRAVPYGEMVTYGELAALAGYPSAQRAAGTFCARNRFAIVVPCHRVVRSGSLGGFGDLGVAYKRRLLALEGVAGLGRGLPHLRPGQRREPL